MEVKLDSGDVSNNITDIYNKWHSDFSSLFADHEADIHPDYLNLDENQHNIHLQYIDISILEFTQAIDDSN